MKNKNMPVIRVVYFAAISLVACTPQQECPTTECPVCSEIAPQTQVQLSQLDASSRERLKQELLAEMKEDYHAKWRAEFEKNHPTAVPQSEPIPCVPKPLPTALPDKLPPTKKIERDTGGMKILRHLLTSNVDHRLPVDEREAFAVTESSVYCFVEISASEAIDRTITIKFTHTTGLSQSYSLPVSQSPAWRTWSKLNLTKSMTGTWLCEVFNEDNVLLASHPFVVVDE